MRKPAFCICENKAAVQLCGNRTADQRLCFRFTYSTIPFFLNPKFQALAIFCDCTAWFVSDQVRNPEDRFSHNEAHCISVLALSLTEYDVTNQLTGPQDPSQLATDS